MPVGNASAKKTFSSLRRLKTWSKYIGQTMSETQMTGFTLLNIHRDIGVDIVKVIQRLCKSTRKLYTYFEVLKSINYL